MVKYRILKNDDHYILQRKRWFFWSTYSCYDSDFGISKGFKWFFTFSIKFTNLEAAKKAMNVDKHSQELRQKQKSKYRIVKTYEDTELYKVLNGEDNA